MSQIVFATCGVLKVVDKFWEWRCRIWPLAFGLETANLRYQLNPDIEIWITPPLSCRLQPQFSKSCWFSTRLARVFVNDCDWTALRWGLSPIVHLPRPPCHVRIPSGYDFVRPTPSTVDWEGARELTCWMVQQVFLQQVRRFNLTFDLDKPETRKPLEPWWIQVDTFHCFFTYIGIFPWHLSEVGAQIN